MSRIWITSDLHIGHDRDFIYKDRGFETVKQHDDALVENWNKLVEADDVVYILGDVMMKHNLQDGDFSYGLSILEKLNGRLIIIREIMIVRGRLKDISLAIML